MDVLHCVDKILAPRSTVAVALLDQGDQKPSWTYGLKSEIGRMGLHLDPAAPTLATSLGFREDALPSFSFMSGCFHHNSLRPGSKSNSLPTLVGVFPIHLIPLVMLSLWD